MKFEEVLSALREGKKVTCSAIKNSGYQYIYYEDGTIFNDEGGYWHLTDTEIVEIDDWGIIKEGNKVKLRDLTIEQYKKHCRSLYGENCYKCPFHNVSCIDWYANCWIHHKDLYSDKFLDQEIEIEED